MKGLSRLASALALTRVYWTQVHRVTVRSPGKVTLRKVVCSTPSGLQIPRVYTPGNASGFHPSVTRAIHIEFLRNSFEMECDEL